MSSFDSFAWMVLHVKHRFWKHCIGFLVTKAPVLIYFRELHFSKKKDLLQRFEKPVSQLKTIQAELSKLDMFMSLTLIGLLKRRHS